MAFRFRCQSCDSVHAEVALAGMTTLKCPACGFTSLQMEEDVRAEAAPAPAPAPRVDVPRISAGRRAEALDASTLAPGAARVDETQATIAIHPDTPVRPAGPADSEATMAPSAARAQPVAARDPLLGSTLGRCEIQDRLGAGAMGVVYRGFHLALKRPVAVKVLPEAFSADPARVKQFLVEAQAAARLEHQNIVQVYDVGQHEKTVYIVMQFIEGESLGAILRRRRVLPIAEAVQMAMDAARGLGVAHAQNIVHQDVKPENILVPRRGGGAKVADFGLAADVRRGMGADQVVGTPAYISPEQVTRLPIGAHSDIYSLGATLYHLVTGSPVFESRDIRELLRAHVNDPVEPPILRNPSVPQGLSDVIVRMLAKEPEERPASMADVLEALEPFARETTGAAPGGATRAAIRIPWNGLVAAAGLLAAGVPWIVAPPRPDHGAWAAALATAHPAGQAAHAAEAFAAANPGSLEAITRLRSVAAQYPGTDVAERATRQAEEVHQSFAARAREQADLLEGQGRTLDAALALLAAARAVPETLATRSLLTEVDRRAARLAASGAPRLLVLGGMWRGADGVEALVPDLLVDRTEVTVAEYARFLATHGDVAPPAGFDPAAGDLPVTNVTRGDAAGYAAWLGRRLPSEAEWEWSFAGPERRAWPWGAEPDTARMNCRGHGAGRLLPVATLPTGAAAGGLLDGSGNADEWIAGDGAEGVAKGGGYDAHPENTRIRARLRLPADARHPSVGFRTVSTVEGAAATG